jgi:hypothetical protein
MDFPDSLSNKIANSFPRKAGDAAALRQGLHRMNNI